jgi:phosphatidylglycerophosphatase A
MSSDHRTVSNSDSNRNRSQAARRLILTSPAIAVASLLGAGFIPVGSGTIGSALALPLVEALRPIDILPKSAAYLILFILFAGAAHRAGRLLGNPDHQAIVCDEVWAMAVVWECTSADMRWMLVSFVLFRIFDIAKPWPISAIDRNLKTGLGVMFDDALAAIPTIVLVIVLRSIIAGL